MPTRFPGASAAVPEPSTFSHGFIGRRPPTRGRGMEAAANCSLRVKRQLLDPNFEGYKLSLEPLACYQVGLESPVAEIKLRDDQYTLDHVRAFGMYNYLHLDSWYQDNVYYVDQLGRVMNLSVTL
ncbi:NudC domain-containing protein 1, partial [Varanus komodoensis]